jgi:hypothetical protein
MCGDPSVWQGDARGDRSGGDAAAMAGDKSVCSTFAD